MSSAFVNKSVTVPWVRAQKGKSKLTMLTAYDYPTAVLLDQSGIDMLLVGDSVGTVIYGHPNTLAVTMDDMVRHTQAVTAGVKRSLVVGDLPFMSYQVSKKQALKHAGRLLKEAGAQAVKLEGGIEVAETVTALTRAGIPVVGHIGLTPQSIHSMGYYRTHGRTLEEHNYLMDSARAISQAGAFAVVLECVEENLASEISQKISIPTIGIGSGKNCDGQVLVTHDLVGLTIGRVPRFVDPVANLSTSYRDAIMKFIRRTQEPTKTYVPETATYREGGDAFVPSS